MFNLEEFFKSEANKRATEEQKKEQSLVAQEFKGRRVMMVVEIARLRIENRKLSARASDLEWKIYPEGG